MLPSDQALNFIWGSASTLFLPYALISRHSGGGGINRGNSGMTGKTRSGDSRFQTESPVLQPSKQNLQLNLV